MARFLANEPIPFIVLIVATWVKGHDGAGRVYTFLFTSEGTLCATAMKCSIMGLGERSSVGSRGGRTACGMAMTVVVLVMVMAAGADGGAVYDDAAAGGTTRGMRAAEVILPPMGGDAVLNGNTLVIEAPCAPLTLTWVQSPGAAVPPQSIEIRCSNVAVYVEGFESRCTTVLIASTTAPISNVTVRFHRMTASAPLQPQQSLVTVSSTFTTSDVSITVADGSVVSLSDAPLIRFTGENPHLLNVAILIADVSVSCAFTISDNFRSALVDASMVTPTCSSCPMPNSTGTQLASDMRQWLKCLSEKRVGSSRAVNISVVRVRVVSTGYFSYPLSNVMAAVSLRGGESPNNTVQDVRVAIEDSTFAVCAPVDDSLNVLLQTAITDSKTNPAAAGGGGASLLTTMCNGFTNVTSGDWEPLQLKWVALGNAPSLVWQGLTIQLQNVTVAALGPSATNLVIVEGFVISSLIEVYDTVFVAMSTHTFLTVNSRPVGMLQLSSQLNAQVRIIVSNVTMTVFTCGGVCEASLRSQRSMLSNALSAVPVSLICVAAGGTGSSDLVDSTLIISQVRVSVAFLPGAFTYVQSFSPNISGVDPLVLPLLKNMKFGSVLVGALGASVCRIEATVNDVSIRVSNASTIVAKLSSRFSYPGAAVAPDHGKILAAFATVMLPAVSQHATIEVLGSEVNVTTAVTFERSSDLSEMVVVDNKWSLSVSHILTGYATQDADVKAAFQASLPAAALVLLSRDLSFVAAIRRYFGVESPSSMNDVNMSIAESTLSFADAAEAQWRSASFLAQHDGLNPLQQTLALLVVNSLSLRRIQMELVHNGVPQGSLLTTANVSGIAMADVTITARGCHAGFIVKLPYGVSMQWDSVRLTINESLITPWTSSRILTPASTSTSIPEAADATCIFGAARDNRDRDATSNTSMRSCTIAFDRNGFIGVAQVLQLPLMGNQSNLNTLVVGCNSYRNATSGAGALVGINARSTLAWVGWLPMSVVHVVDQQEVAISGSSGLQEGEVSTAGGVVVCPVDSLGRATSRSSWQSPSLASIAASVFVTVAAVSLDVRFGSGIAVAQLAMRQAALLSGNACNDDGAGSTPEDSATSFLGDPLSNPLQVGHQWMLADSGIPPACLDAVGCVVGAAMLLVANAVWATASELMQHNGKFSCTLHGKRRGVIQRMMHAFRRAGGIVSSYYPAYVILQQPLMCACCGLLIYSATVHVDAVIVTAASTAACLAMIPLVVWGLQVGWRWRRRDAFPFSLRHHGRRPWRKVREIGATEACRMMAARLLDEPAEYWWRSSPADRHTSISKDAALQFVPVFDDFRCCRRWYFLVDATWNAFAALLSGLTFAVPWCGIAPAIATVALTVGPTVSLVALRPQRQSTDWMTNIVVCGLSCVAAVLTLVGDTTSADSVSSAAALVSVCIGLGVAAVRRISACRSHRQESPREMPSVHRAGVAAPVAEYRHRDRRRTAALRAFFAAHAPESALHWWSASRDEVLTCLIRLACGVREEQP